MGGVEISGTGRSFIYTPPAGFIGMDRFDYGVRDASGALGLGSVEVSVVTRADYMFPAFSLSVSGNPGARQAMLTVHGIPNTPFELLFGTVLDDLSLLQSITPNVDGEIIFNELLDPADDEGYFQFSWPTDPN